VPSARATRADSASRLAHSALLRSPTAQIVGASLMCAALWLVVCLGVAATPRDRSSDIANVIYYDAVEQVQWEQGRARVLERWTRLFPRLHDWAQAIDSLGIDGRRSLDLVIPPDAVARTLAPRMIELAGWQAERQNRGNRRVLEWGWPAPVLSCTITYNGSYGFGIRGGIPGARWCGWNPESPDLEIMNEYDESYPSGGVIPYRVHWAALFLQSLATALLLLAARAALRRCVAWRRQRCGLCAGCGYDLRDALVCPECGRRPPTHGMTRSTAV
jgi:hypothetical protein